MPCKDPVPLAPIQDLFERSGLTTSELTDALDWRVKSGKSKGKLDVTRLERALGLKDEQGRVGTERKKREQTSYENAVLMVRAMGFYPVDADL